MTNPSRLPAVPALLQGCVHVLIVALLAVPVLHGLTSQTDHAEWTVTVAVALAVVYALGPAVTPIRVAIMGRAGAAGWWLLTVLAVWMALLALSPDAIWLAFPWFFLILYLLPWRSGLAAVAVVTAVAIAGFAWHHRLTNIGTVLGPILGALVAVATAWGYRTVMAESDRRRVLIAELQQTRSELAAAERAAGAMVERERLAREIHDTIAQGLSSIQMLLRAADRTLPRSDQSEVIRARTRIEQARQTAADNLAEARRFVAELTPPSLQGQPLAAALGRLCDTTADHSGLTVNYRSHVPRDATIPTAIEVAALRIAQSALANVVAHAGADRVQACLVVDSDSLSVTISDDGAGFAPNTADGFGLPAIRARAAELGGQATITAQPGRGVTVTAVIPLGAAGKGEL